jgi:hypothetical protein
MQALPEPIVSIIRSFSSLFSRSVFSHALELVVGAILSRGKRTVTSALRMVGRDQDQKFPEYHYVLSCAKWSALSAARILLGLLTRIIPDNEALTFVVDDTVERRNGKKIKARGCYRDAVRSSQKLIVNCFGLKWLSLTLLVKFPWCKRRWALPVLTILQYSEKTDKANDKRHKTSVDWTVQLVRTLRRWVPTRDMFLVADGAFASISLCTACIKNQVTLVSRLKLNGCLYDLPPERKLGTRGRRRLKGDRLRPIREILSLNDLPWKLVELTWYSGRRKNFEILSFTCMWAPGGCNALPILCVLVRDPEGKSPPIPLLCTNVLMTAEQVIEMYVERWNIEVTFEEMRAHMGMETQRQWSDGAIARTTPALMGIFSMVCLMAHRMMKDNKMPIAETAWYHKVNASFSDVLTFVRQAIWREKIHFSDMCSESTCGKNGSLWDDYERVCQLLASATG